MRGKRAPKRKIDKEPKYDRLDVAKFINYVMKDGKKTVAQKVVYGAFEVIKAKTQKDPVNIFDQAIKKVGPSVEVRGKRVGGANYQVPFPVLDERKFTLACRWILDAARKMKGRSMAEKLAQILVDSSNNEGPAIKKREETQRMADANKAFAHFAKFG